MRESLLSASMRACYVPWRGQHLRFDVCSGAFIGVVTATGRGYAQGATHTQPWLAVPVEVALAALTGPVGLELGGGERGKRAPCASEVRRGSRRAPRDHQATRPVTEVGKPVSAATCVRLPPST
ncbi:MAG TPA: hypothetical protein VK762_08445 [Polyangiaceae bacterium]|nr:hypothetical protein [Polyangiaceae bacterium]